MRSGCRRGAVRGRIPVAKPVRVFKASHGLRWVLMRTRLPYAIITEYSPAFYKIAVESR